MTDKIREKFEAVATKNNLSEDEYSLASRVYQAAYQQALDDVVEMLGSCERLLSDKTFFPILDEPCGKSTKAEILASAALTAIKQKVREV
jgi:hypothetical protein